MLKFVDEYRNADLCLEISKKIKSISKKNINIMEVCGGHTAAIRKNGIQKLIGKNINLISGPGCPVCVTSMRDIDTVIALSKADNAIICTFGDLFYVPGSNSNLARRKAEGADVRIVYSVYDALNLAKKEKNKKVIFVSIGFETTAPTAAAAIIQADLERLDNFFILELNKTMPRALRAILEDRGCRIDALICPGHVSVITGIGMYRFIVEDIKIPCCISGFEPLDIMAAIYILTELCEENKAELINAYKRAVLDEGNKKAQAIMSEVFEETDAEWRGLGVISSSGLGLRNRYAKFKACKNFNIGIPDTKAEDGCMCGEILKGAKRPPECPLFGKVCTPLKPKGACMVSSEGSCAIHFKYGLGHYN